MILYLLVVFYLVLYCGDDVGLNITFGQGLSLKNLFLYLICLIIAINAAVTQNRKLEALPVFILFGTLVLYALMTLIAAGFIFKVPDYSIGIAVIRLKSSLVDQFLTFFIFFYGVLYMKEVKSLLRIIVWIVIAGDIVTLIDSFDVPDLGIIDSKPRDGRFVGFIGGANGYGAFLALMLPATIALYFTETGIARKFAALGVFSSAFALLLTFSRGAYVGVIIGSIVAAIYLRQHIQTQVAFRTAFIAFACATAMIAFAFALGFSDLFENRLGRFEGNAHVASSGRTTIWGNALRAMLENPISFVTGFGFSAYETSRQFYAATHNQYLNVLYNLGAIGLFLFVGTFVAILSIARSAIGSASRSIRPFFIGAIFGLCAFGTSIFFSEYSAAGVLTWAYLGVVTRLALCCKADSKDLLGKSYDHTTAYKHAN